MRLVKIASIFYPLPRAARWTIRRVTTLTLLALIAVGSLRLALRLVPPPGPAPHIPASTFLTDRNGAPLAALVSQEENWHLPLAHGDFSPHLLRAIVAVEDRRFYEHAGVDYYSAAGAAAADLSARRIVRGASTLTMQVVRLRDPAPRSFAAKAEQAFRALQLELNTSKEDILTEYLNRAPFGGNLVGAGAASWRYFGKPCSQISLGQAALLAGLPQSPNRFRPDRYPDRAIARRDMVLYCMLETGAITLQQFHNARTEPLDIRWQPLPQSTEPALVASLPAVVNAASAGRTSLSLTVSRQAFELARQQLASLRASGVTSAAAVVLDTQTAELLAAVSLSDDKPHLDLTRSSRSSGSTLKPFIYAAAFDAGILRAATMLDDSPTAWAGYLPANFDRDFRGRLPAGEALAESRNIPAMTTLAQVGVEKTVGLMQSIGLHPPAQRDYGLSLAIGGAEVTPLQLAEAYATLARDGRHLPVATTPQPADRAGALEIIGPVACRETLAALASLQRTRAVAPEAVACAPAWKTGTSNGRRDAWCAAVTPRYTVVVWLGNASGAPSELLVGHEAAAPLALRLIASLDPADSGYASRTGATDAPAPRAAPKNARLSIATPAPNQEFYIAADFPAHLQRIRLTSLGGDAGARFWFVDNALLPNASAASAWWTPTPGRHEVRVTDATGHASTITITVR